MLETRGWISLFLGVICTVLAVFIMLFMFNIVGFDVNQYVIGWVLYGLLIVGGVFLLFDSAHEMQLQAISIIVGIVLIAVGGLSIVGEMGWIGFNIGQYLAIGIVRIILLLAAGIFLIFGAGD